MPRLTRDIYRSFRALPGWVQLWVGLVLVPVNSASLLFVAQPMGVWIAFLAIIAMLPNLAAMIYERGFSRLMALPHLLPWTLLVALLILARPEASGAFAAYLWLLLATDALSLAFDCPDARAWLKGEREVAGRP
ncbi:MAG: hypothetical protein Q8Q26_18670 [Pseudorhodobacter sp.]|nr:hypothetical protein [Pseudorhodobacter sp.]